MQEEWLDDQKMKPAIVLCQAPNNGRIVAMRLILCCQLAIKPAMQQRSQKSHSCIQKGMAQAGFFILQIDRETANIRKSQTEHFGKVNIRDH